MSITYLVLLIIVAFVPHVALATPRATPQPSPPVCNVTQAQGTYTNITDYLTWNAPSHSSSWHLQLSDGRYTGDFPDPISYNGSRVRNLNASGEVLIDSATKTGKMHVWFTASNLQPVQGQFYSGQFDIYSTDFDSTPANDYVPFMMNGIATGLIEHGCTGQGEPGYPQLKGQFATWGHCDVYLNGTLLYANLWLHTMYTNRMRDPVTNAIWANVNHTQIYTAAECWEGDVNDDLPEFQFIVARWCYCPACQVHKPTDLNIIFSFPNVEDLGKATGSSIEKNDVKDAY